MPTPSRHTERRTSDRARGLRLRALRVQAGLSRTDVAELTGLTEITVARIESGADMRLSSLLLICRALGVHVSSVLP